MTEKKNKEYYSKCAKKIDQLLGGLFDDCEDGRAAIIVIESVAFQATGLLVQATDDLPPEKKVRIKMDYLMDTGEILAKGLKRFMAEKATKKE